MQFKTRQTYLLVGISKGKDLVLASSDKQQTVTLGQDWKKQKWTNALWGWHLWRVQVWTQSGTLTWKQMHTNHHDLHIGRRKRNRCNMWERKAEQIHAGNMCSRYSWWIQNISCQGFFFCGLQFFFFACLQTLTFGHSVCSHAFKNDLSKIGYGVMFLNALVNPQRKDSRRRPEAPN